MSEFSINQLLEALQGKLPTPEWRMDPSPHYFVENYSANKETIMDAMKEYEDACARAKVRMYMKIGKTLGITV